MDELASNHAEVNMRSVRSDRRFFRGIRSGILCGYGAESPAIRPYVRSGLFVLPARSARLLRKPSPILFCGIPIRTVPLVVPSRFTDVHSEGRGEFPGRQGNHLPSVMMDIRNKR